MTIRGRGTYGSAARTNLDVKIVVVESGKGKLAKGSIGYHLPSGASVKVIDSGMVNRAKARSAETIRKVLKDTNNIGYHTAPKSLVRDEA